ncbi:MAG: LacI family DNA-binding transcriptional regulator, partial [Actinobacteria bacterium]|nr:LacI family DNA-binding transcriptional regulator [Actinomycetota bacterium]
INKYNNMKTLLVTFPYYFDHMNYKNITLKDVAKESNMSISTVSRVVNNEKYVSPESREKVYKAIKELNYHPELTARNLRLRESNTIGVIIPKVADYFFANIVLSVQEFFMEKGKDIILFNTYNDEQIEEKAIRLAVSKRVEGIVLVTICKNEKIIESIMQSFKIPIVVVDNRLNIRNVDQVLSDDIGGSFKLINHLVEAHGYKNIACISGPLNESSGMDKYLGYKKALDDHNISVNDSYLKVTNWRKSEAYDVTEQLMELNPGPEAIYCANANLLIGCLRFLIEHNIKVPEEIALVTFDDYDFVSVLGPPVTSLNRIDREIGEKAAGILFKRIQGYDGEYREIRIESDLVIRKSCGCN